MEDAAREIQSLGASLVIVKGGHRQDEDAIDVAFDGRAITRLSAPWVATRNVHGTGCSYSAAIAANLARGLGALEAATAAKAYVHRAIVLAASWELGAGHGPIDHVGAAIPDDEKSPYEDEDEDVDEDVEAGRRTGAP
jgi:hydroxymethylpyrimidine/phosphomethylpyrimidine kinase